MSARKTAADHAVILYVEDDALTRTSLGQRLLRRGFQVIQAESGEQAVQLASENSVPAAVLLDVELPGMDGAETYRRLRQLHPDLSAIVYSADLTPQVRRRLRALGVQKSHMLSKPCTFQEIVAALDNVLANPPPPSKRGVD